MKLRIVPIMLTVVISASVLFGGWFLYRHMALQNPLATVVSKYDGVKSSHIDIKQDTVTLNLELAPDTNLQGLVQHIKQEGKSVIGKRELRIQVEDHSSEALINGGSRRCCRLPKRWTISSIPIFNHRLSSWLPSRRI